MPPSSKRTSSTRYSCPKSPAPAQPTTSLPATLDPVVALLVDTPGLYRVSYEQLRDKGFDLAGVKARQLAVTRDGQPVPFALVSGRIFGKDSYIEFYGEPIVDSLYTETAVYQIHVDRDLAERSGLNLRAARTNKEPTDDYVETAVVEDNVLYIPWSANGEPWGMDWMYTLGGPAQKTFTIEADNVADTGPASLTVNLYGRTTGPHHVQVFFNGVLVDDASFDGMVDNPMGGAVDPKTIRNGVNEITVKLVGDTGSPVDMVIIDGFSLEYHRNLVARDGYLAFEAQGANIQVSGLPQSDILVYRINHDNGRLVRLDA